ncbi:hypothetical protein PIB30_094401 [Stylosanthes scabra]|uniref:Uncharacterized protein n=1 Tax=Stylosanthes scabra TaxID=79078 RepID=A0ABU6YUC6_9FABA|nr:hypothetical protein [Stylosanthes scabra]
MGGAFLIRPPPSHRHCRPSISLRDSVSTFFFASPSFKEKHWKKKKRKVREKGKAREKELGLSTNVEVEENGAAGVDAITAIFVEEDERRKMLTLTEKERGRNIGRR